MGGLEKDRRRCSTLVALSGRPSPLLHIRVHGESCELCVGELGAGVYGSSSMRQVHQNVSTAPCLPRCLLKVLHGSSTLATAPDTAALAFAFSHARLLGQGRTQRTTTAGSGSRVACGVRGLVDLAPTQRHSHRAQASNSNATAGAEPVDEQRLGCLSRPAFSQRAPLLNSFPPAARYTWLSSAQSLLLPSHHTRLLAYPRLPQLPAGRRSTASRDTAALGFRPLKPLPLCPRER